jgi:hypothetical protein
MLQKALRADRRFGEHQSAKRKAVLDGNSVPAVFAVIYRIVESRPVPPFTPAKRMRLSESCPDRRRT